MAGPPLSPIDEQANEQIAAHRIRVAAAARRVRNAWPEIVRRFVSPLLKAADAANRDGEMISALALEAAFVWYCEIARDPIRVSRKVDTKLAAAEQRVSDAAALLIGELEEFGALQQWARDVGNYCEPAPWEGGADPIFMRLASGSTAWAELCGVRDGALREVIRVCEETSQQSPDALAVVRSVFPFVKLRLPSKRRPVHPGSDPSGEEAFLRLFMEALKRIGHNSGCRSGSGPLDWVGPTRIAALLQVVTGNARRPTKDAVKNARNAVRLRRQGENLDS